MPRLKSINKFLLIGCFLTLISACSWFESTADNWVVQYEDEMLTEQEIKAILPLEYKEEDSIALVNRYIDQWLKNQVFIQKGEENLSENAQLEIEQQLASYRLELMADEISKQYLTEVKMDSISDQEIEKYYEEYKNTFLANQDLIEYKYIRIPEDSVQVFRKLFNSEKPEDMQILQTKVLENNYLHQLKTGEWIEFETFKKTFPLPKIADNKGFLERTKTATFNEGGNVFLLKISNYVLKGTTEPFLSVKPTIKNLLINKRKLNLLSNYKNELYQNALQNGEIKKK